MLLQPSTKLGQGYIFTGVCDSVKRGGVCLSACWDTTPQSRHSLPRADPPEQTPKSRHPRGTGIPPGADPPSIEHAGRYGQRAGGTHPTGMQSCLKNASSEVFRQISSDYQW